MESPVYQYATFCSSTESFASERLVQLNSQVLSPQLTSIMESHRRGRHCLHLLNCLTCDLISKWQYRNLVLVQYITCLCWFVAALKHSPSKKKSMVGRTRTQTLNEEMAAQQGKMMEKAARTISFSDEQGKRVESNQLCFPHSIASLCMHQPEHGSPLDCVCIHTIIRQTQLSAADV